MFLFLFLFFSMQLICSFFRLFQVKNGLTKLLLFCFQNAKNLGQSDDAKRRKKEDGLTKKTDRMDKTLPQRRFTLWPYTQ